MAGAGAEIERFAKHRPGRVFRSPHGRRLVGVIDDRLDDRLDDRPLDDRPDEQPAGEDGLPDDDELTAFALAADVDAPLDADAESFWDVTGTGDPQVLPQWYMPVPAPGTPRLEGWRRMVVFAVIIAFLTITASGLCNTYGNIFSG